ncbi:MAG: hypothetical protein SGBAC_010359 [Bacillariaceae sp.]
MVLTSTTIAIAIFLLATCKEGFAFSPVNQPPKPLSPSQLLFNGMKTSPVSGITKAPSLVIKRKKPSIARLSSLDELKYFLLEDDRMAVIKFDVPWCKRYQRLGLRFKKLASELGDGFVSSKKVQGQLRFAEVAYSPKTNRFIEDELQVEAMPTLQVYHGFHKLWERSGTKYARDLRNTVLRLESKTEEELLTLGETQDDGILQDAMEDTMYDSPDNLDTR